MVSFTENDPGALISLIDVRAFVVELYMRARVTGRRVIVARRVVAAHYGAARRARAAVSRPPCRTWPPPRVSLGLLVSPPTRATAGTAPP